MKDLDELTLKSDASHAQLADYSNNELNSQQKQLSLNLIIFSLNIEGHIRS